MLISLAMVGGAMAVVRGLGLGSAAQPATADVKTAYAGPLLASRVTRVVGGRPVPGPEDGRSAGRATAEDDDEGTGDGGADQGGATTPDARGPVEGEVPQAPPARPAEPVSVVPVRAARRRTPPESRSPAEVPPVSAGQRVRSALGVVLLVLAVGLVLAMAVAVLVVAISRALHGAVD